MSSPLEIRGPKYDGLLNQYKVFSWKYLSARFGLLGEAIQASPDLPDEFVIAMARKKGNQIHRRFEGKNGWLWKTIYDQQQKMMDIEYKHLVDYMLVPRWLKWIRGKLF